MFARKPEELMVAFPVRFCAWKIRRLKLSVTVAFWLPLTSTAIAINCCELPTVKEGLWGVSRIWVTAPTVTDALVVFVTEEFMAEVMLKEELPAAVAL